METICTRETRGSKCKKVLHSLTISTRETTITHIIPTCLKMALVPESGNPKSRILYVFFCSRNIGTSKLAFPDPNMLKLGVGNENKGYKNLTVPCQSKSIYWAYKLIERNLDTNEMKNKNQGSNVHKRLYLYKYNIIKHLYIPHFFLYDKHNVSVWAWNKKWN